MKSALQRRRLILSATALAAAAALPACGGGGGGGFVPLVPNVVQSAQGKPELSVFVEAVNAADLGATLQGAGPYTVFAPTNDAFTDLLAELGVTKDALLANKPLLTAVLKYHVLSGTVRKADIPLGKAIVPLAGGFFKIEAEGSALKLTDGRNRVTHVVSTDGTALNGVIHVVDHVLLPANKDIVQTAQATPSLGILVEAVVAAGLVDTLKGPGPYTVFAPTNAAFAALLSELGVTKDALLADTALLTKVLTYHVLPARVLKAEITLNTPIATVQGQTIVINSSLQIIDQRGRTSGITSTDIFNTNGVVHVIDRVLLPG
jgi:uncharacterized surface protein with fasciclin (FAS1) repeats